MANPCLLTAIQQLDTVLTLIDGTGNYTTTVGSVQHISGDWTLQADAAMPSIGIHLESVDFIYNPSHIMYGEASINLRCLFEKSSSTSTPLVRLTNQVELLDDILEALSTDVTLNGSVISVTVSTVAFDVDEGIPNAMNVPLIVRYERTTSAS